MKKFILLFVFTLVISKSYSQSAMATVNGSNGIETGIVHALDDAVITLEIFPNSEDWAWVGPNGDDLGSGAGIIVSQFSSIKQGQYKAVNTVDLDQEDVVFDLIYLEENFAGIDQSFTACPGEVVTLKADLEGLLYSWSTNESTNSIEVSEDVDVTYELTVSTVFGDSDSADFDVMRTEVERPDLLTAVTHSISCAQEGQLTLTLQDFDIANLPFLAAIYQEDEIFQYVFFRDTTMTIGLSAGTYDGVVIPDYQGCSFSYNGFSIDTFSGVREEFDAEPVVICEGQEYTIEALGGYENYLWEDGSTDQYLTVSPNQSQSYKVSLLDSNGCGIQVTHSIIVNPTFDLQYTIEEVPCGEDIPVNFSIVDFNQAHTPYQLYAYDNGNFVASKSLMQENSIQYFAPGSYGELYLESSLGCVIEFEGFVANTSSEPINVLTMATRNACQGQSLTLRAFGGAESYLWSTGETTSSIRYLTEVSTNVTVDMTDENGCTTQAIFPLNVNSEIELEILSSNSICGENANVDFNILNFDQNAIPYTLRIFKQNQLVYEYQIDESNTTEFLPIGSYDKVTATSINACEYTFDGFDIILENPILEDQFFTVSNCTNELLTLDAPVGFDSYLWSNGSQQQSIDVSVNEDVEMSVIITDFNGCQFNVFYTVTALDIPDVDLTVNQRSGVTLGSIELDLSNTTEDMFPIEIFITDSSGDTELIDVLSDQYSLIQLADDFYENVTLVTSAGCLVELDGFVLGEETTYEEITNSIGNICANSAFLLSAPSGSNNYVWNDGSVGRFLVIFPTDNTVYSCLATDLRGNQINYIFNVEVIPAVTGEYSTDLGSVGISLIDYSQDDFPIQVSVTNTNGVVQSLGMMNSDFEVFGISEGEYFDLTLITTQGCETVLGDFTIVDDSNGRIGNRVTGQVWLDFSQETGVMEQEEEGLSGVIVRAINIEGDVKGTAMTNGQGEYTMDLEEDTYYMEFTSYGSYSETLPNMGTDENLDSEIDGSNGPGTTEFFNVSETFDEKINAGYVLGVLSVDWLSVSVNRKDGYNHLLWEVESEYNVSHYEIERSVTNTKEFSSISTSEFSGENKVKKAYTYEDYQFDGAGTVYYRVKQVDINGKYSYSDIVSVTVDQRNDSQTNSLEFNMYPNPMISGETLNINLNKRVDSISVDIYSISGSLVMTKRFDDTNIGSSHNSYVMNLNTMEEGNYIILITAGNEVASQQLNVR